jgi:hypothetical protein
MTVKELTASAACGGCRVRTYYAVVAVGHGSAIDAVRDRLFVTLDRPATFRLLSYAARPSGVVTHSVAEVRFSTDASDERLDLIEAAEVED